MATGKKFTVKYRRKREGKTNYKKRLAILKSNKLRLVIRKSLKNIIVQIIEYDPKGDKVIMGVISKELDKLGWKFNKSNIPSAYLTGLLLGKKAVEKKIKEVIVDIGLNKSVKGSKLYAVVKGVLDGGLNVPCTEDIFPKEDRICGKHISDYYNSLKENEEKKKKQFKDDLENMNKVFEEVKNKVLKS